MPWAWGSEEKWRHVHDRRGHAASLQAFLQQQAIEQHPVSGSNYPPSIALIRNRPGYDAADTGESSGSSANAFRAYPP